MKLRTWLALGALGVGVLMTAVAGLFVYMSVTAVPIHPDAADVPTLSLAAPAPEWTAAVEHARQIVRAELVSQNLPGLSVAIGVDGALVWAEGFGFADMQNRVPVAPTARFRIGTASIALTSAAAGLLLERGQLKLDEEIQTYVPDYPRKQWPVTIRALMGHTAGVRTDGGDEGPFDERCETTAEGVKLFGGRSLLFEPGTRYRFSSFGWILVSAAVESAAGRSFETFMRDEIFEPLGMQDTQPDTTEPMANRAIFYFPRFAADNRYGHHLTRRIDYSCYSGAAGFLSSAPDLVRFAHGMAGGKVLQPATVAMLQTSERLRSGDETGYGLGWDLEPVTLAGQPAQAIGHNGLTMGGMAASLITFRDRRLVVAVLTNTAWADTFGLGVKVAGAFAEQGPAPVRR